MYKIRPIQTKEEQERICLICKTEYNADELAYVAVEEDGTVLGVCRFAIKGDTGEMYELKNAPGIDDYEPVYIMGRATLSFIDLCGVKKACYKGEDKPLVRAIGFKPDESENLTLDLAGFFEHKCSGNGEH